MMMVHKFTIECGGQRVAWARAASSARALGVEMPGHLPVGFAPVSRLQGRFVIAGIVPAVPTVMRVATQDLSPESVINVSAPRRRREVAPWVTVVDSEGVTATSGEALKVASVVSTLLVSLIVGCLVLARRSYLASLEFSALPGVAGRLASRAMDMLKVAFGRAVAAFRYSYESWQAASDGEGGDANPANSLALVHARLADTELLVATLPGDLLLREVLESELDSLRNRAADVARRVHRLGATQVKAALRSLTRDLDSIVRIVHGAAPRSDQQKASTSPGAPATVFEACRVLGLNPEAPFPAVKKVVEALRMSWHPDHARDEADRLYREQRIKQINAAWDLLKGKSAAAA